MDYRAPLNSSPTLEDPLPAYFDGNKQAGIFGAIPPGKAIEFPQREILAVIQAAGLTPSGNDLTQLLQAIQLIAGGVGGAPASFALNPVYPETLTGSGVVSITPTVGQVVLATGQQWTHRGGELYNSTALSIGLRTLATVASKTYHMRWRYNAGVPTLLLYDLADVGYNPGAVAETDTQFDTTYDDMLLARVVTNGANLPVVTALKNLNRLAAADDTTVLGPTVYEDAKRPSQLTGSQGVTVDLNWARKPSAFLTGFTDITAQWATTQTGEINVAVQALSRYQIRCIYQRTQNAGGAYLGYSAVG